METTMARQGGGAAKPLIALGIIALIVLGSALVFRATRSGTTTNGRVSITEPLDGATVASPVRVKMAAENFKVEPAGPVAAGHGHLHILVDTPCVAAGQVIPKDDKHLHYGKGQTETELKLTPGKHTLCLQAANGAHVALDGAGLRQTITVTAK
jgi:hypothetical protein